MKKIQLIFVIFLLLISGQRAQAENGVIWEKSFLPYKLLNAVFSPDDKYIYATCTDIYYVIKYDLEGNILDTIKNVGGIRKFSDDGKYFWNVYGDKYTYPSLTKVTSIAENLGRTNFNFQASTINEHLDIGVIWDGGYYSPGQFEATIKNNLVIFKPSDMKIIKDTSYPGLKFDYRSVALHPTNGTMAIYIADMKRQKEGTYRAQNERFEIWDINSYQRIREISTRVIGNEDSESIVLLRYSPDGSVLGYQHDGKLTLYSTTDYSVVWESELKGVDNFNWSNDSKYLYISFVKGTTFGLKKYSFPEYSEKFFYQNGIGEPVFINISSSNNLILTTRVQKTLYLLDNTVTSITDSFFTTEYKTTLKQNPTNGNYQLQIDASQPNILTYYISDINGNIIQPNITQNLEQGMNQIDIETTIFPSGTYFINIEIASHTTTIKFMLVR